MVRSFLRYIDDPSLSRKDIRFYQSVSIGRIGRLRSAKRIGAEFASISEASRKLRANRARRVQAVVIRNISSHCRVVNCIEIALSLQDVY